jgi:hypothetical protein
VFCTEHLSTGLTGSGVLLFVGHGVPLLIASLVVSGGATAAQTGDKITRYYSNPNRLAERMVALARDGDVIVEGKERSFAHAVKGPSSL